MYAQRLILTQRGHVHLQGYPCQGHRDVVGTALILPLTSSCLDRQNLDSSHFIKKSISLPPN